MRALITGGTGFVGHHLLRFLHSCGIESAILASNGPRAADPKVKYYKLDIRDAGGVRRALREFVPDHIYHLAGISTVADSLLNPRLTYEVNVLGSHNLFEAATEAQSPLKILNVSTSQVYAASRQPLTEDSPIRPSSPYAASKAMAELMALQSSRYAGAVVTARAFNHTGPGQAETYVLPSMAKQACEIQLGRREAVISVGNLDVRRDFTDVRDVVRAYYLLLEKGVPGEIYNVCSGRAVVLADILEEIQLSANIKVRIDTEETRIRREEVPEICGDSSKLRAATGWSPQIQLSATIKDLLEYWQAVLANNPQSVRASRCP